VLVCFTYLVVSSGFSVPFSFSDCDIGLVEESSIGTLSEWDDHLHMSHSYFLDCSIK